jgi:hypothetical protein
MVDPETSFQIVFKLFRRKTNLRSTKINLRSKNNLKLFSKHFPNNSNTSSKELFVKRKQDVAPNFVDCLKPSSTKMRFRTPEVNFFDTETSFQLVFKLFLRKINLRLRKINLRSKKHTHIVFPTFSKQFPKKLKGISYEMETESSPNFVEGLHRRLQTMLSHKLACSLLRPVFMLSSVPMRA